MDSNHPAAFDVIFTAAPIPPGNYYPQPGSLGPNDSDAPSTPLRVADEYVTVNEQFQDFLMYHPDVATYPIWVPVGVIEWNWSASTASADGGTAWTFISPSPTGSPSGPSSQIRPGSLSLV